MNRWSKKVVFRIRFIFAVLLLVFLVVIFFVSLMELKLWSIMPTKVNIWFQLIGLLVAGLPVVLFFSHSKEVAELISEEQKHILGGKGETEVRKQLEKLGPQFKILPHIEPGKLSGENTGDVDIVVVSHKGVVAIEVKTITNFVALRYYMNSNIAKARNKAVMINELIQRTLGVYHYVTPMLVIAGNYRHLKKEMVDVRGISTMLVGSQHVKNAILGQTDYKLTTTDIKHITDALSPYRQYPSKEHKPSAI
jgi:Holliday junction resolvase-like predicted endonuclease